MSNHDSGTASEHARLVALATEMLAGSHSYIEGAVEINRIRSKLQIPPDDDDFATFVLIDSETDALPLAEKRSLWSASALEKLEPEIERSEKWARKAGATACQRLIDRFMAQD